MKEVKAYLKNDLNHYLAQCNRHRSDLLANKIDHLTTLAKERTTEGIAYAENLTLATGKAIQACSDKSRTILTKVYLQKELNKQVMVEMGYGSTRYFELKHIALCEFAKNFEMYLKKYGMGV